VSPTLPGRAGEKVVGALHPRSSSSSIASRACEAKIDQAIARHSSNVAVIKFDSPHDATRFLESLRIHETSSFVELTGPTQSVAPQPSGVVLDVMTSSSTPPHFSMTLAEAALSQTRDENSVDPLAAGETRAWLKISVA